VQADSKKNKNAKQKKKSKKAKDGFTARFLK
jgi:hypothetical protein